VSGEIEGTEIMLAVLVVAGVEAVEALLCADGLEGEQRV